MRKDSNKGAICGAFGILSVIAGIVLIIIGNNMFNNFYAQVEYYYQHGSEDYSGRNLMTGGIIMIVVGIILLIVSLYFFFTERRQFEGVMHNQEFDEVDDVIEQMAGTRTIFDVFHNKDHSKVFSFSRDKTCKLKDNGEIYLGKMEPLKWENGHPTLWRITLDYKGHKEVCQVTKVEGNILVKNDKGEAIFYRGR